MKRKEISFYDYKTFHISNCENYIIFSSILINDFFRSGNGYFLKIFNILTCDDCYDNIKNKKKDVVCKFCKEDINLINETLKYIQNNLKNEKRKNNRIKL